ncbi:MAG: glycosyltransferase family 2 protein [Nitrospirota bacterium]
MTPKLCIAIPAYNASGTIGEVITGSMKYCPDIIVADDGSDDDTSIVAKRAGAKVIRISRNRGKGNALKLLFKFAHEHGYEAVITVDADGQHDPDSIPLFIEVHQKNPDQFIVGSRMGEKEGIPEDRLNSMQIANFYSSLASNQFLEDTQCGFRLYPLSLIQKMELTTEKYVTETELLIKAGDIGTKIIFVNIKAIYNGNTSHFRALRDISAITAYIIYYLTIKWLIEGVSADRPYTYVSNNIIDRINRTPKVNTFFEAITAFIILPATFLFLLEYILLSPFMNNFASIRKMGCSYIRIAGATLMLPVLVVLALLFKTLKALNIQTSFIGNFIRKFYPELKHIIKE